MAVAHGSTLMFSLQSELYKAIKNKYLPVAKAYNVLVFLKSNQDTMKCALPVGLISLISVDLNCIIFKALCCKEFKREDCQVKRLLYLL